MISATRALLTKELISEHKLNKVNISKILGVSPSAITQYTNEKRGAISNELNDNKKVELIIRDLADHLKDKQSKEGQPRRNMTIIDASYNILAIIEGSQNAKVKNTNHKESKKNIILKDRLEIELREAQKSLEIANKIDDGFGKLLFKEIASDSMRHAEIVSQIMREEDVDNWQLNPRLKKNVKEMIEEEENASEQSLMKILKPKHPALRAIVQSVDQDELKHKNMLKTLSKYIE
tara:strand:- start:98 stop:802 length:705 start_codon:yes stop_codon:yes gene_type:complete